MSETVIKVENLGKRYKLGLTHNDLLSESMMLGAKKIVKTTKRLLSRKDRFAARDLRTESQSNDNQPLSLAHKIWRSSDFYLEKRSVSGGMQATKDDDFIWALKEISFEVKRGEILGIIGRNGAGKSTLLKILSEITEPTEGRILISGKIGSLLEVGTGFHPELTGRENIYLNGSILGMARNEIKRKFDEIVAFSEIEKFIDTPVKRYSSGMYVRLAFAVAAHLEPDILLVDEVLAVGDVAFQKKCLGKMGDVAKGGRTVLFVSHNMGAVQSLCTRGIILEEGMVDYLGPANRAILKYLSKMEGNAQADLSHRFPESAGGRAAWYTGVEFRNRAGESVTTVMSGEYLEIVLKYCARRENMKLSFAAGVYSATGEKILHLGTQYLSDQVGRFPRQGMVICQISKLPLPEGRYRINISLHNANERVDHVVGAALLNVESGDYYGTGKAPSANESKVFIDHQWVVGTGK